MGYDYSGWPAPPKNNGVGHHFGDMTVANFNRWLPDIKALNIKWLVLASQSEEQIGRVAYRCLQEGIMPIGRPIRAINGRADFGGLAMKCSTKYIQIFNEADLWRKDIRPDGWEEIYRQNWIGHAHKVRAVGCKPGLQVGGVEELHDFLTEMKQRGDDGLFPDMWLALHLYPPLTKPEPLHAEWPYICGPDCTEHPDFSPQGFRGFAKVCEEIVGYPLPIIVTEGGLPDGMADAEYRAWWMTTVYGWFKDGTAPDYLLAWCPFILADEVWHGWSWLTNDRHGAMVDAVKGMGDWERGKPTPPIPPEEPKNYQVLSPRMTEDEARKDLRALYRYGFNDWYVEEQK